MTSIGLESSHQGNTKKDPKLGTHMASWEMLKEGKYGWNLLFVVVLVLEQLFVS